MQFRLLTIKEAAALLGKSEEWLRSKIRRGQGPPAKRVSERCIQIRLNDLRDWVDKLKGVRQPR